MNPVQFKITSTEEKPMTKVKGMTVFNTNDVNTKKQPMFLVNPWGFKGMIILNTRSLKI